MQTVVAPSPLGWLLRQTVGMCTTPARVSLAKMGRMARQADADLVGQAQVNARASVAEAHAVALAWAEVRELRGLPAVPGVPAA